MGQRETSIMFGVRAALVRSGHWRGWRCNSGKLKDPRTGRYIEFGIGKGCPDLVGIQRTGIGRGRMCCFETKSPGGRLSKDQIAWHKAAREDGAFVAVARSEAEALEALGRALAGGVE